MLLTLSLATENTINEAGKHLCSTLPGSYCFSSSMYYPFSSNFQIMLHPILNSLPSPWEFSKKSVFRDLKCCSFNK